MLIPIFISSYQGKIRSPASERPLTTKTICQCLSVSLSLSWSLTMHARTHTHALLHARHAHTCTNTHPQLSCSKLTRNDKIFVAPRQRGGLAFIRNLTRGSLLVPNKPFPTKVGQKFDFLETLLQLICSFADIAVDSLAFPMILTI